MTDQLASPAELLDDAKRALFVPRPPRRMAEPIDPPLGDVSRYVVTSLPKDLSAVRAGTLDYEKFSVGLDSLAASIGDALLVEVQCDPHRAARASVDANFLVAAAFHTAPDALPVGARVPPQLQRVALSLSRSTGKIPIPSYEDLIFLNDLNGDARVFSDGPDASAERDFYLAHRYIERCFDGTIGYLDACVAELLTDNRKDMERAVAALTAARDYFESAASILRLMGGKLDPAIFGRFRPYFFAITVGGGEYIGASGRYTTGLPTIEALIADSCFRPAVPPELDAANPANLRGNFPRSGMRVFDMRVAEAVRGRSLGRRLHAMTFPEPLTELGRELTTSIKRFRVGHLWAVRRQIAPDGLSSAVPGTGGVTDVRTYLETRRDYNYIAFPGIADSTSAPPRDE